MPSSFELRKKSSLTVEFFSHTISSVPFLEPFKQPKSHTLPLSASRSSSFLSFFLFTRLVTISYESDPPELLFPEEEPLSDGPLRLFFCLSFFSFFLSFFACFAFNGFVGPSLQWARRLKRGAAGEGNWWGCKA